jgi:hypothetical protein
MHELTLVLPDDLYAQLQAEAASKGMPLAGLIVERLAAEIATGEQREQDKRLLHEAIAATGLLQPVSSDLVAAYVADPAAPRQSPVRVQGKPLSAIIIDQRAGLK